MKYLLLLCLLFTVNSQAKWQFEDIDDPKVWELFLDIVGEDGRNFQRANPALLKKWLDYNNPGEGRVGGLDPDFDFGFRPLLEEVMDEKEYKLTPERLEVVDLLLEYGANFDFYLKGKVVQRGNKWHFTDEHACKRLSKAMFTGDTTEKKSLHLAKRLATYSSEALGIHGGIDLSYHCSGNQTAARDKMKLVFIGDLFATNGYEIGKALVSNTRGIDPNYIFGDGRYRNPFMDAVGRGDHKKVVLYHELGADINYRTVSEYWETPLSVALDFRKDPQVEIFLYLVDNGANLREDWPLTYGDCEVFHQVLSNDNRHSERGRAIIKRIFTALKKRNYNFRECDGRWSGDDSEWYVNL
jgi:hypothetical protein